MTRWVVTGAAGMLGRDILALLHREREQAHGLVRADLDVTDATAVRHVFRRLRPEVVVNVTDRKGHDRRYSLDDTLLRGMGYSPARRFKEGLNATVRWYAENRDWWEPLKAPSEAEADGRGAVTPSATGGAQDEARPAP